jgi:hypothetical protein
MAEVERVADLLRRRNRIDREISKLIDRPCTRGHIGEFIASKIFKIRLESSATAKGVDGVFAEGPLRGKTVNIKLYGKQEGFLDIAANKLANYYLVLTGPKTAPTTSRGTSRPLVILHVYLFKMPKLMKELKRRGVKIGIATSVAQHYWIEAEIYPRKTNKTLEVTKEQIRLLELFAN